MTFVCLQGGEAISSRAWCRAASPRCLRGRHNAPFLSVRQIHRMFCSRDDNLYLRRTILEQDMQIVVTWAFRQSTEKRAQPYARSLSPCICGVLVDMVALRLWQSRAVDRPSNTGMYHLVPCFRRSQLVAESPVAMGNTFEDANASRNPIRMSAKDEIPGVLRLKPTRFHAASSHTASLRLAEDRARIYQRRPAVNP